MCIRDRFLTLFLHPIICAVLAAFFSKKVNIVIPLCQDARVKRKRQLLAWTVIGVSNLVLMIISIAFLVDSLPSNVGILVPVGIVLGMLGMLVAFIFGQSTAGILRPIKITKTKVWLRGVHSEIVDKLPLLPQDTPL